MASFKHVGHSQKSNCLSRHLSTLFYYNLLPETLIAENISNLHTKKNMHLYSNLSPLGEEGWNIYVSGNYGH